jgi:hypothetical protein
MEDLLSQTVRSLVAIAAAHRSGAIVEAERVVDTYLATFHGYRNRRAAIDKLLNEPANPLNRAFNRGGLFELVEMHLRRRHHQEARWFQ